MPSASVYVFSRVVVCFNCWVYFDTVAVCSVFQLKVRSVVTNCVCSVPRSTSVLPLAAPIENFHIGRLVYTLTSSTLATKIHRDYTNSTCSCSPSCSTTSSRCLHAEASPFILGVHRLICFCADPQTSLGSSRMKLSSMYRGAIKDIPESPDASL